MHPEHLYFVLLWRPTYQAKAGSALLEAENIEARPVWKPMHLQPVFQGCRICGGTVSEDLFIRGLCLPSGSQMNEEDVDRVALVIRKCFHPR